MAVARNTAEEITAKSTIVTVIPISNSSKEKPFAFFNSDLRICRLISDRSPQYDLCWYGYLPPRRWAIQLHLDGYFFDPCCRIDVVCARCVKRIVVNPYTD